MSFIPLNINNIKKRKNPKSQNLWNNTGIALALVIFAIFVISINTVQRNLDRLLDYRFRLSNRREWVWDWLCLYFWPWREYTFNHSYSLRRRSRKITDSSIIICPCAIVTLHKLFDSAIRKFPLWVSFKNFCLDFFVRSVWVLRNFKRSYETLAVHEKEKECKLNCTELLFSTFLTSVRTILTASLNFTFVGSQSAIFRNELSTVPELLFLSTLGTPVYCSCSSMNLERIVFLFCSLSPRFSSLKI